MNESEEPGVVTKKRFSLLLKLQVIAALVGAIITLLVLYIYDKTSPHQIGDSAWLLLSIIIYPAGVLTDFFNLPISLAKDNGHGGSSNEYSVLGVVFIAAVNALLLLLLTTLVGLLIKFIKKANKPM
jgi:hypothetical protein